MTRGYVVSYGIVRQGVGGGDNLPRDVNHPLLVPEESHLQPLDPRWHAVEFILDKL